MKRPFLLLVTFAALSWSQPVITPPKDFLGFAPGDDYKLADYETIISYFKRLDQQSTRLRLQELGSTTEGRPLYLALISSSQNLQNRQQIIATQARLADPESLRSAEAKKLIANAPVIVSINCSIHPREIGPSQMSMELAYRLVSDDSPETLTLLRNTVLLLIPSHNPDGLDLVVEWYNEQQRNPDKPIALNKLDHPYTGHDLNRDWCNLSQKETRLTVEQVYNVWHPHLVFDLHQMGSNGARMFLPPFIDPYDPYMDPVLQAELSALGTAMAMDLTTLGLAGIVHNVYFDSFSPARSYIYYHAGVRLLGEIASAKMATPITVKETDLRTDHDFDPAKRSWRQPLPWKAGDWRLSDIVRYGLQSSLSLLRHASANHELWINNSFQVLKKATAERASPLFYVIPNEQHDPYGVYELLALLKTGMVDIYRSRKSITIHGRTLSPPMFVIPARQPYGGYVQTLMEETLYEDLAPSSWPPYDVTTHHLPSMLGVQVLRFRGELSDLEPVEKPAFPLSKEIGPKNGKGFLVDYRNNQAVKAVARLYKIQAPIYWLKESTRTSSGALLPAGTLYIDQAGRQEIEALPVDIYYPVEPISAGAWRLQQPRIALYSGPPAEIDEGWTRFILEEYGFYYSSLTLDIISKGDLRSQFDVIIVPDQSSERLAADFKIHRTDDPDCLQELRDFVEQGGTLMLCNRACDVVVSQWALGVKNVVRNLKSVEYFVPGSLLRMIVDTHHPLGYGLPRDLIGMVRNSPAFQILPEMAESVAVYPGENLLKSGLLRGESHLALQTAVACIALGQGRIVLLGLQPQFRGQMHATYKLFFNGIVLGNAKSVERPE